MPGLDFHNAPASARTAHDTPSLLHVCIMPFLDNCLVIFVDADTTGYRLFQFYTAKRPRPVKNLGGALRIVNQDKYRYALSQ